jgi:outer membrane protein assembly factor BamA
MLHSTRWLQSAWLILALVSPGWAQESQTRAAELQRQREEKAKNLEAPEPSGLERWLLRLEEGRLFERLLNPAEGFYPKLGNITPGSGFAAGPAYRRPGLFGGAADFSAFATVSTMRYWMVETRLRMPRLAEGRVAVDVYGQRTDYPREQFYGLGPDSSRDNEARYALANTTVGGAISVQPARWLFLGGGLDWLSPDLRSTGDELSIERHFTVPEAPGLDLQPTFLKYTASAEVNDREPRGNPRRGGRYAVAFQKYVDQDGGRDSFDRVEIDLQHYVPLLRDRRVLALRAFTSLAPDRVVPFYFQRTLGGPDDLRGFRRFRFRDSNQLLLQAEYRWEIFTAMDGAIFYDAGAVAGQPSELSLGNLESDYGIGFRFGTSNGVFLRVEGAFGSRDGKHFVMRYGHVF